MFHIKQMQGYWNEVGYSVLFSFVEGSLGGITPSY